MTLALTRQVQVPTIGDELVLAEPWTFRLYNERRNYGLFEYIGAWLAEERVHEWTQHGVHHNGGCTAECKVLRRPYTYAGPSVTGTLEVTLPAGAVLAVDRIYLRKGASDFDSITFIWRSGVSKSISASPWTQTKKQNKKAIRFWAKLHDVNKMVVRSIAWTERDAADAAALKAAKAELTRHIELE